jgi:gliding motility-associated-like protein
MFVDYIGTGPSDMKYKVTIILYRICIGNNLALGNTTYGTLRVTSPQLNFTYSNDPDTVGHFDPVKNKWVVEDTLDNLCPAFSAINSCRVLANTSYSGYSVRTYVDTVVVPGRSSDLKFSWSSCCRLASYTNINGLTGPSFYVEAGIDNTIRYNNNSPRYLGQPFTFCCTNQPSSLSNIPSDPDGDSLITFYNNTNPGPSYYAGAQQSATTDVLYNAGYTAKYPTGDPAVITGASYSVGPISGKASFVAPNSGKYVFGYRTEDRDRVSGKRLGDVSRDVTITVLPCTNLPPYIDSIPSSIVGVKGISSVNGEVVMTACPQAPLSFVVNAHSNNTNGLIYMRAANVLPAGMTITPTVTGGTGYVTVNWTPTAADLGPHVVSILAVDSTCAVGQEITLRSEFTFTIIVRPGLDAGPDLKVCPLGEKPVLLGTNANPASGFSWTNLGGSTAEFLTCTDCPKPLASPPYDYTYVVTTDDPLMVCKNSDTLTVFIDTSNHIDALQDKLIVCRPGYINLLSQAYGPAPIANIPCGVLNNITCATPDSVVSGNGNTPAANPNNTPFFSGKRFHSYQFIIRRQELLNSGLFSGTLNGLSFLAVNPTLIGTTPLEGFTISLACTYLDTLPSKPTNNDFFTGTTLVKNVGTYTLTPNAWNRFDFDQPYNWDTTQNLLVDICMGPIITPNAIGTDPVAMTAGTTIQRYDDGINVCGGAASTVQFYRERPVVKFFYCRAPELPFTYWWRPGTYLQDSNAQNPLAFVAKSIDYAVYTVGRNGCRYRDTLHIKVPEHKINVGPQDTFICVGQPGELYATGGTAYSWFEVKGGVFTDASNSLSCTNCSNPIARPKTTTKYAVVFSNDIHDSNPLNPNYETGCPDTLFTTVNVWALPPVNALNRDTTITYGQKIMLYVIGADQYTWTPVGSLSDPHSPNPIAAPKETTTYVVSGRDTNGCVYRDSVRVVVNYLNTLLVPTGFTPNGDGRNDVFKIVNVSFQRLMEFRVFNRWGQEVFSTTDINSGWDGTWRGEPQEVGNYQYLIRIGFPDGRVETYKGDVALVR